jgi:hypothetical protein
MKNFKWSNPEMLSKLQDVYNDPYSTTHLKAVTVFKRKYGMYFTKEALQVATRKTGIDKPYLISSGKYKR